MKTSKEELIKHLDRTNLYIKDIKRVLKDPETCIRFFDKCSCGGEVYCGYADWGGASIESDHYFHVCSKCGKIEYSESHESHGYAGPAICPFCQYNWSRNNGHIWR